MNHVTLIGRLVRDPQVRIAPNDAESDPAWKTARYTLAVSRHYKSPGDGADADFIRCIAFGKQADIAEEHLARGMRVGVEGRIRTGSYVDREKVKHYTTDVVVLNQEFLSGRDGGFPPSVSDAPEDAVADVPDDPEEEYPFR